MNEPQVSSRGFKHFHELLSESGSQFVKAYESSNAMDACIWLAIDDRFAGSTVAPRNSIELTLENAKLLADQLNYLAENHYQNEEKEKV